MSQDQKHLTAEQIECLLDATLGRQGGDGQNELVREARRHIIGCGACQRLFAMHEGFDGALQQLRQAEPASATNECPSENSFNELFEGLVNGKQAEELLAHASQCDHCGPFLREAAEIFSEQDTYEEAASMMALQSSKAEWRARLVRQLASVAAESLTPANGEVSAPGSVRRKATRAHWVWAFATATVVCVFAGIVWRSRQPRVEQLLAQAYSEQRTMELRMDGAGYAPIRVRRGAEDSRFAKPTALLEAEALIAANLSKHPGDPRWLESKARSDLLEGNYQVAINLLQKEVATRPGSTALLKDLAVAHFLRAESDNQPADYGSAIEYLSEVLAASPNDPVALFNHAIASERLFLYSQAANDWEHYLSVEPDGPWSDEARKRQMKLREKMRSNDEELKKPLLESEQFVAAVRTRSVAKDSDIDDRIEQYLDLALSNWLPAGFALDGKPTDDASARNARRALTCLANYLAETKGDVWLRDLLADSGDTKFARAVLTLNRAIKLNAAGKSTAAMPPAAKAAKLFIEARNPAGAIRARVEEIYSLHHSAKGEECLSKARSARDLLGSRTYAWIQIQLLLEEGSCFGMLDDMDRIEQSVAKAVALSRSSGYRDLSLRVMLYAASVEQLEGRNASAWALHVAGLRSCWDGICSPLRAFQFYDELDYMSGEQNKPWLAAATGREAALAVDSTDNVAAAAMCHRQMAHVASEVGRYDEAKQEYEISKSLFAKLPQDRSERIDQLDGEIGLAGIDLKAGNAQRAASRLQAVESEARSLENFSLLLGLYQTLGQAEKTLSNPTATRRALSIAIAIGELGLQSISSEHDRLMWSHQFSVPYRSLVELNLSEQPDGKSGLELWEVYLAAPLRARRQTLEKKSSEVKIDPLSTIYSRYDPPRSTGLVDRMHSLKKVTILAVAVLSDRVAIWNYDDRGIDFRWLTVSADELLRTVAQFRDDCSDPSSNQDNLRRRARLLYDWIISPIASRLDPRRSLIVELDGTLGDFPWQALVNASGSYLGDALQISQSPGLLYRQPRERDALISSKAKAVVVAAPAVRNEFASSTSSDAAEEAAEIAKLFSDAKLISGNDATLKHLERSLPAAEVFHFAGHAVASPQGAALLLASENTDVSRLSTYNADRVRPAQFRVCRLAVLAACATARADEGGLSGPESLVRALLRAGVTQVVASRWDVDSAATSEFMRAFYRRLLEGKQASVALHEAAVEIRSKPGMSHPYYWAGFAVFGEV